MITRIKIDGFKSLLNTELYFSPFTCIAGANAMGKSNFFDALMFLSKLVDNSILEAAKSIRSENQKHSNIKDIFYKSGDKYQPTMRFEVDMIVANEAEDDFGQMAKATTRSLRYILELQLNDNEHNRELIEIKQEKLVSITQENIKKSLYFEPKPDWTNSIISEGNSTEISLISTEKDKIRLHQDGENGGRTMLFSAEKMPRTLLSNVTSESPTAFLARHEMRTWLMLQLEPSALREPNSAYEIKNAKMTAYGNNLPATLYRLYSDYQFNSNQFDNTKSDSTQYDIYQQLTNQMKVLVPSVDEIFVDNDEKRDLLTLQIRFKDGLVLPAQSLSDGTLRFLGLAILKEDSQRSSLICLEEPENGMHPKIIKEIISLLQGMASDTNYPVDASNPLRQVIINSHSPLVVSQIDSSTLYMVTDTEFYSEYFGKKIKHSSFLVIEGTWRTNIENNPCESISYENIKSYLSNFDDEINEEIENENTNKTVQNQYKRKEKMTVKKHFELQYPLEFDVK